MNKTLNNISLLAFAFVAIVVTVNLFTTNNYGRANAEVIRVLQQQDHILNYHQLRSIASGETEQYRLIDLRDEAQFTEGHLPNAINIPLETLLDRTSLRKMKKSPDLTNVLYAADEATAHTARLLLIAKGMDPGIMVLGGGYQAALKYAIEEFDPAFAHYKEEKARFDFNRFMNTGAAATSKPTSPAGVIPATTIQTVAAQGGC
jgi:rhodanese-related sulfurtransferase